MMKQSDWQAVRDALIADDRAKLGEPPTVEEILAYERGELSREDADRVQQLLIAYPELARAFATPFPSADEDLPNHVVDRQWNAFRAANRTSDAPSTPILQFWRGFGLIAATVAMVLGVVLYQVQTELLQPHILPPESNILTPDGRRGLQEQPNYTITPTSDSVVLVVSIIGPTDYETYHLELVSLDSHKHIWSSEPLRATSSNSFNVEIPSRALPPGTYQMLAYGLRGNAQALVATYTMEVQRRAAR